MLLLGGGIVLGLLTWVGADGEAGMEQCQLEVARRQLPNVVDYRPEAVAWWPPGVHCQV